jgi:membrane-bound metal-dependent hydrolase YbcI (DUF457 family)
VIAGHFGLAAGVKGRETEAPLWALMLATVWLDIVFVPLVLAGVETILPGPAGTAGGYGNAIIHADWTHSLVGAVVLSLLFGAVAAVPWGKRVGAVLGAVVFSHWLLDLVVHRADLPILPANAGNLPRLGFGLWQAPMISALVELLLVLGGAWLYWRAARQVTANAGAPERQRAVLVTAALIVAGVVTLGLDLAGL